MFFATTTPAHFRRYGFAPNGNFPSHAGQTAGASLGTTLERFMNDTLQTSRQKAATFEQDDTSFTLSFDVPGIAKDQLKIGIEGSIVRIASKEGAPRQYKATYELPQDLDPAGSEAKLDNGVLTLKLVKRVVASAVSELTIH